jgi:ATP-dependent RNA helicase DeaD
MTTRPERLPAALARALAERGYRDLTPVQRDVLSAVPHDVDMLVSAQTGSGKTVAFGLAVAGRLLPSPGLMGAGAPRALVIAPTRELAMQVREELAWLYGGTGLRIVCCTGGADIRAESAALAAGVDLVVGSPGRLRDHILRGSLDLGDVGCVVLDEADDMLDMGFRDDLETILEATPPARQTLMFTATVSPGIEGLAQRYQRAALRIAVADLPEDRRSVTFQGIVVAPCDRENVVVNLLRLYEARGAIAFCGRRGSVAHLVGRLAQRGFRAVALSGALSQRERNAALAAMRAGRARVCVATDLAARGLDLPMVELVIHVDLPPSPQVLLHRSGRTGRAGRTGRVVLMTPRTQRRRLETLAERAGVALEWVAPPGRGEVLARDLQRMIADPVLAAPVVDSECEIVAGLLSAHGPDRVAAAFGRLWSDGLPEPEELDRGEDGIWFALDLGPDATSDIETVLALIVGFGGIEPRDVGRIRLAGSEARFELRPSAVPRLLASAAGAAVRQLG